MTPLLSDAGLVSDRPHVCIEPSNAPFDKGEILGSQRVEGVKVVQTRLGLLGSGGLAQDRSGRSVVQAPARPARYCRGHERHLPVIEFILAPGYVDGRGRRGLPIALSGVTANAILHNPEGFSL